MPVADQAPGLDRMKAGVLNDQPSADCPEARILEPRNASVVSPMITVCCRSCPDTPVTRPLLREAVDQLFAGTPDIALFFFAGHGFVSNKGGYLRTTDARRYDEGVSMDEVLLAANESRAPNKVVILDCCHAGAMGSPALNGSDRVALARWRSADP